MTQPYQKRSVSLSRLLGRISELFEEQISPHEVWVKAEVSSFKKHSSGHLYFDLVEQQDNKQVARCRASVWRAQVDYVLLKSKIDLRTHLEDGREILCLARAVFHPVFGLSLNISDVDPDFALGEVEKRRRASIEKLKKEGLLTLNRSLPLPPVVQKLAIMAAPGSAGLADLLQQLSLNQFGYAFSYTHFEVSVQGANAISSILDAYSKIDITEFDAVVLIRGGGASLDLDVFNDYKLNAALAVSKLPFIVGIGHETDQTVIDEWAAVSLKTPSAVGAWLVERCREFDIEISTYYQSILELYRSEMERQKSKLSERIQVLTSRTLQLNDQQRRLLDLQSSQIGNLTVVKLNANRERIIHTADHISMEVTHMISESRYNLSQGVQKMDRYAKEILVRSKHNLSANTELIEVYQPDSTLKRGYSYLKKEGQIVVNDEDIQLGDQIEIETFKNTLKATIQQIQKRNAK